MMKFHLTYTGYYAGKVLCGANKQQGYERGEKFIHAMFAPLDNDELDFCEDCLEVWNDATESE